MTERRRIPAREINQGISYTCWAVFRRVGGQVSLTSLSETLDELGVTLRGLYDVSGMRADADLMVWLHGPTAEGLQRAVRLVRGLVGGAAELTWSAMGLHRPAEFNKGHVPAYLAGFEPREWVAVYPFVRSHDWYLLPEDERRAMLLEHGMMGRDFPVLSNTVSAFALGDYEWLLALESDALHELVDLMRTLRAAGARRHVSLETPFFTGRRVTAAAAEELLA